MNRSMLKHLYRVLWIWLILVDVLCEDGVTSKSEKHRGIEQENGPKDDSLVRSFVSTRASRSFTTTSSFDDGRETDKPPDDGQSTIRLRNDTVDLSKNTVPVLKYPGPTEPSLKEKFRRTTPTPETTPLKKSLKLKRNMTRTRPSDLTTLLVYNALTPGRYPSTTQVAESMPPTAWALASLKGPEPPAKVKPFVSWSTRLSRPTTIPPITELTDVTELEPANQTEFSASITTAPGDEETVTTPIAVEETTFSVPDIQGTTLPHPTERPADITSLKPEENTISVPPLASFKTTKINENFSDFSEPSDFESLKDVRSSSSINKNDSILLKDNVQQNSATEENNNKSSPFVLSTMKVALQNNTTTMLPEATSQVTPDNNDVPYVQIIDESLNKSVQEIDPSINIINEKKNDEHVLTSTVISAVNSTITIKVAPPVSASTKSSNITNIIDVDQKLSGDDGFKRNLPQDSETTTLSNIVSHSPIPHDKIDHESVSETNQTINDIKVVTKNNKITPIQSDVISIENPSTLKSNEIKPDHTGTNTIKSSNDTQFLLESVPSYAQEIAETTQSNDIQVQDQIKPINKTYIQQFLPRNSSQQQNQSTTTSVPSINNVNSTVSPTFNVTVFTSDYPSNYVISNNSAESTNETSTNTVPITTTPSFSTTIIPETTTSISDLLPSSPEIPIQGAANISSTTAVSMNVTSTVTTSSVTTTVIPSSVTPTSNDIKDQEIVSLQPPEIYTTNFDSDSKNSSKKDTPLIFHYGDEEEDESLTYNHTDVSYKKGASDTINNNDNDDDSDDMLEASVHNNVSTTLRNFSNLTTTTAIPIKQTSSLKPSTVTPADTTHLDEDHTSLDDDTMYDTGVIMTIYVRLIIQATYQELCKNKDLLKDSIVKAFKNYAERTIDKRQVMIINLGVNDCSALRGEMEPRLTPVHVMLTNTQGQYDKTLNDLFISLARQKNLDFKYPISQVEKVQQETFLETEPQISGTMVAAIIISSIAAVCLFALTILLVIMRKRQTGFNYGQRCTPVSLDDYSLDNISVYNSVRRKAIRASKRSYGNPAFDDPDAVSNPVNFAGLANMASDKSKTDEEFSSLPQVVVKLDELPPGAEVKNRYANVIPIPETRVQLRASSPEDQFINANYVKGAKGLEKFYIACQAPLQNTIEDFWQMVWDEQSRLIIMLTALTENGVEKCADYLPPSEVLDCHRVFGDLQVTLKKREAREKYVISSLQLKNLETNLWREVTHMWYAGWPPTGVPPEPSSVIAFLIEARSYSKSSPIIVHCSPGTGRTGTVIAIDIAIRDFEAGRSVDIPKTVVQVRRGRAGAVQTKDQYSFIYKVLHLYATKLTGGGLDSI